MNRPGVRLARAIAIGCVICGLAAAPALADRDHDHDDYRHGDYHHEHHWRHPRARHDYDQHYYVAEPEVYYAPPPVYVPPAPSWGLNLVFPLRIR